ncbi:hypothetical protein RJT34_16672 [Clitoria ternatea]|uniref:Uncharacterized protein n=1 Tax=Clitoria ternatea TaxID=43366 RepID=A0AAN9J7W3_CLITE
MIWKCLKENIHRENAYKENAHSGDHCLRRACIEEKIPLMCEIGKKEKPDAYGGEEDTDVYKGDYRKRNTRKEE